jgi:Helix-turn-helix domain
MATARGYGEPVSATLPERRPFDTHPLKQECVTPSEAAEYLHCSQGTLENWISAKKFTKADGLRKVGGLSRVHMPTLRARFADGTLMEVKPPSAPAA